MIIKTESNEYEVIDELKNLTRDSRIYKAKKLTLDDVVEEVVAIKMLNPMVLSGNGCHLLDDNEKVVLV